MKYKTRHQSQICPYGRRSIKSSFEVTWSKQRVKFFFIIIRIRHKIAVLTFKAVSTGRPSYMAELVHTHAPARELRFSLLRPNQLHVSYVRTALGCWAFRHAAPAVWNGLPSDIADTALSLETFKSRQRQYLYNQSFRCWSCYRSASAIRRLRTTTYDALRTVYC